MGRYKKSHCSFYISDPGKETCMSDKENAKATTKKVIVSALGRNAFRKTPSAERNRMRVKFDSPKNPNDADKDRSSSER